MADEEVKNIEAAPEQQAEESAAPKQRSKSGRHIPSGIAYVLDERHELYLRLNKELVTMTAVTAKYDARELQGLIRRHVEETGSPRGRTILANWEETLPLFKKILPNDYSRMLAAIGRLTEQGMPREEAELAAFAAVQKGEM